MTDQLYDVLILGGGPAGLTAAIYTSRASLKTMVIAGSPPGGQLIYTSEVENFPGFPNGINGPDLIEQFRAQSLRFGVEIMDENVTEASGSAEEGFTATTETGKVFRGKSVIIASGASAKWLNIESEQRLRGKGVSACAVCDGFFFKGKTVAVVGGGDAAMEEASFLTKFCPKVYLLVRGDKNSLRASKIMQQRVLENPSIEMVYNSEVTEVLGEDFVSGLRVKNNSTGEEVVMDSINGLFLAIGHSPNTQFLQGFVELDHVGYVKVTDNTRSSKEGVFVGGDVSDYRYRQAITAAGLGCMAALDAEKYLAEKK